MKINKQQVIDALGLKYFGSKGWMNSEDTRCPICNRVDKFGVLFTPTGGVTHCFYNCGDNMSLYAYLKHIGRNDLVNYEFEVRLSAKVRSLIEEVQVEEEIPEVTLPKGYERIYFDQYLKDRNFRYYQYQQFEVGITNHFLEKRLHGYLIFVLKQRGKIVGWLARSKKSKEWHKNNLEQFKLGKELLVLRYMNSTGTDFEKILGGFDDITERTETVIAVEGLFDKTNISNIVHDNTSEALKVIFTFGDKFSDHQIKLLKTTAVRKVILMYDANTIKQSKQYSMELSKYFEVDVCYIDNPEIDPGNMTENYFNEIIKNKKNFLYFYGSKLSSKLKS